MKKAADAAFFRGEIELNHFVGEPFGFVDVSLFSNHDIKNLNIR